MMFCLMEMFVSIIFLLETSTVVPVSGAALVDISCQKEE